LPLGAGVSRKSIDEAGVVAAIGRVGSATLCFEVNEEGTPIHFRVQNASDAMWGREALALVSEWRFHPGMKDGRPVPVPALVTLVWGKRDMDLKTLADARFEIEPNPSVPAPQRVKVVFSAPPPYTDAAKAAGLEGIVRISLVVDALGTPSNIQVLQSLGMGLDESAMESVSKWRFSPAIENGLPVSSAFTIDVNFQLK
jgi:TonB family protein